MEQAQDSSEKDRHRKYRSAAAENRNWMKKERIRTKMMLPSIFMSMAMRRQILTAENYENADSMLPVEEGVTYQQCSLDPEGKQKLIYTQDGKRVYYTEDDGKSFEEIY